MQIDPSRVSSSEFQQALLSMSDADLIRVRKAAQLFAAKTGGASSAEDLMQEAIKRTLSGDRTWKKGVPITVYLANAIRSIASHARTPSRDTELSDMVVRADPVNADAQEDVRELLECLGEKQDEQAVYILEYIANGYTTKEILTDLGITQTEYDTTIKRIRRTGEQLGLRAGRRRRGAS
jgi:DNA-directed RNA polymerase specialized sigma24 family protein